MILLVRNIIQFTNVKNLFKNQDFVKVYIKYFTQKNLAGIINFSTIFDDKNFEYNNHPNNNQHDQTISFEWDEQNKEKIEK